MSDRQGLLEVLAERLGRTEVEAPSIVVALAHEQQVEREHAREREPDVDVDERPRQLDQLDQLRAGCDRLRVIVDSYPAETAREIIRLQAGAAEQRQRAAKEAWRAGHWQDHVRGAWVVGSAWPAGSSSP